MGGRTWGYIYLVESAGRHKIGLSGTLPALRRRLWRLHLMNAYGIRLVLVLRTRRPDSLEKELHAAYADVRLHGEWFGLSAVDVESIRQEYANELYDFVWFPRE